jgi:hypothetical protein
MRAQIANWAVLFLILGVVLGCGGEAAGGAPEAGPTAEPAMKEKTPAELGAEIGAVYVEALVAVTDLVMDRPPADEIRAELDALKESYVQRLVALGWQRESLIAADKATVDREILRVLEAQYEDEEWLNAYQGAVDHYYEEDFEFQQILVSFNIIGQYANFDLLREQAPEEAERLGIGE